MHGWRPGRPIAEAEAYLGLIAALADIPLPVATGRWEPPTRHSRS